MPQLLQPPRLHGSPVLDDGHRVAQAVDLGHDVARHEHRAPLACRVPHSLDEHLRLERVESGGRLIEDHQVARRGQRGHEYDLLPVALGVGADRFTGIQAEGLDEVGLARPVASAAQGGEGIEGLRPRERGPQRHVTGNIGAPTCDPLGVVARIHAQNPHHAAVAAVHAQKDADRRRLPRTVGAQETVDPPRLHLQVETVERAEGAEGLDQP